MDATTRKILWAIGIGCVVLVVLSAVGGYVLWARVIRPAAATAEKQEEAAGRVGISVGKGVVVPEPFASDLNTDVVLDIASGELDPRPEVALVAAGEKGVAFLTREGKLVSSISYPATSSPVEVIDVEGDGVCEFMVRGGWNRRPEVFEHDGRRRWQYDPGRDAVDDMAAGDIDDDGFLEFAVGCNGGGGVRLLDRNGKERWRRPDGNVWHSEVGDVLGTGRPQFVHTNAGGELTVRDATGEVANGSFLSTPPRLYVSDFTLVPWPEGVKGPMRVLASGKGAVRVLDGYGKVLAKLPAPGADDDWTRAVWARLARGEPRYLAVLITASSLRSLLYVYGSDGRLVFQETMASPAMGLGVLPQADGTEALLVGGQGRVLKYVASPAK